MSDIFFFSFQAVQLGVVRMWQYGQITNVESALKEEEYNWQSLIITENLFFILNV